MANRRKRLQAFSTAIGQKGKLSAWIRKNKDTSRYRQILNEGMTLYISRLNVAMEKKFESIQSRPSANTIRWRRWAINKGEYVRGKKFGGRMNNIQSDASPVRGLYLSGKLKAIISSCRVEVIGTTIHIITPKYIDDFRKLDPTKSNVTVNISKALAEKGVPRDYRDPPAEFLGPSGIQFRLARRRVLSLLKKEAGIV